MSWDDLLSVLAEEKERGKAMGGPEAIERLHGRGKLTPRERLDLLFDAGTFREIGLLAQGVIQVPGRPARLAPCDGVVMGWGELDGRRVFAIADDGTIASGARGAIGGRKVAYLRQLATDYGYPFVQLLEASAGRMQGMMGSQFAGAAGAGGGGGGAGLSNRGGIVPTVSAIMGFSFGGPSFQAPTTDFIPMVKGTGFMGVGGPPVVLAGIGQEVEPEELGGSSVHAHTTGLADYEAEDDADCVRVIREFLGYLPSNCWEEPPRVETEDPPDRLVPAVVDVVPLDHRRPYDMYQIIRAVVDDGRYLPIKPGFAENIITCYARLNGHPVGIVANQPSFYGGINDAKAGFKTTRFVQICDAYNIPLVFLQDQPGFIIGSEAEREHTVRAIAKYQNTIYRVTVPILTVILRKAYGYSYWLLGGKPVGADLIVAWPSAAISLAGPEVGVNTLMAREMQTGQFSEDRRQELYRYYREVSAAVRAAYEFRIDDVIDPAETRRVLCEGLEMALWRRRKGLGKRRPIDA